MSDIFGNIGAGVYDAPSGSAYEHRRVYEDKFKADLKAYLGGFGVKRDDQADMLVNKAWDDAHPHGYTEVVLCAEELLEFVQAYCGQ